MGHRFRWLGGECEACKIQDERIKEYKERLATIELMRDRAEKQAEEWRQRMAEANNALAKEQQKQQSMNWLRMFDEIKDEKKSGEL